MKVAVIGQGYVDLPLSMRAVAVGHDVVGIEVDPARLKRLQEGESYVEDIPTSQLQEAITGGRYTASAEYRATAGFDVAVITVPTRLREDVPDLSYIEDSARG